MKLRAAGYRLLVAHGSFVHHAAHATFVANEVDWHEQQVENQCRFREKWGSDGVPPLSLISVCLIVKDEEQMLASCLESVADIADEIVVYDTGSTDRTVEIARAAGARVIEGYWDDSFARARNAALAHARGEWVVSLDADETLLADPEALRTLLEDRRSNVEAYLVAIENLHGAGNARSVHTAIRLFRRTACTWRHRLHEQVVAADDPARRLRIGYLSGTRIIHRGYAAEVFEGKNKAERNLALAAASLDDEDLSPAYALMNYGRALESAGRSPEAIATLREAVGRAADPITQRLAIKNLIYIFGRLGRFEEALETRRRAPAPCRPARSPRISRKAVSGSPWVKPRPDSRCWPVCRRGVGTTKGWSTRPTCFPPCAVKRSRRSDGSERRPTSSSTPCGATVSSRPTSASW